MILDRARLADVLAAHHEFYGSGVEAMRDERLNPNTRNFIVDQFEPGMVVLDVGCGDGQTLFAGRDRFARGVGIDNDSRHIELARTQSPADNIEYLKCHSVDVPSQFGDGVFDFVFSERGPLGGSAQNVQAARAVLKVGGTLFCETIGDQQHREVKDVFSEGARRDDGVSALDQVKTALVRNGFELRISSDLIHKRVFADAYAWLEFQCDIWAYAGRPLPTAEDERIEFFVRRHADDSGRIALTHHVVWAGGVKLAQPQNYWEHAFYPGRI